MAEERESGSSTPAPELASAAALRAASREEADSYLRKQGRLAEEQAELARLQKQNLTEQNAFELSHLRWRRFNDQMKGALQIMLVALGLLIVIATGAALWSASRAEGLVVDEFSVPPRLADNGISGDVVAEDMTNRIGEIGNIASGNSLDTSADVRSGRNSIKVEIPDTGVSISEAWRYLRLWLGNERHMSGAVRLLDGNRIAFTAALDGAPAIELEGPAADLDKLEQTAAEHVFAKVDPVNYVLYLDATGRTSETLAQAALAPQLVTTPVERADAYSLWAWVTRRLAGNFALARQRIALAIATDPKSAPPHVEIVRDGIVLGHDEEALQAAQALAGFRREDQAPHMQGSGFDEIEFEAAVARDSETGDFRDAAGLVCSSTRPESILLCSLYGAQSHDAARGRVLLARAEAAGVAEATRISQTRYLLDADEGAWSRAAADARFYVANEKAQTGQSATLSDLEARTKALPLLAEAQAQSGDSAGALATIGNTPPDCYNCVRVRGDIDALRKDWTAAAYWFARAIQQAPDVPFAYDDWGRMFLVRGQYDAAIAKFAIAHQKGPHFADPLEMWGKALVAKNRSDLALAKFTEADKYAPNWGRLHLKWGEALWWSGDKDGARKQFAIAAALTPSEKSELMQVERLHG